MMIIKKCQGLIPFVRWIGGEYDSYVKRRIRAEIRTDPNFLTNKEKLFKMPLLQKEISNYFVTLNEGDENSSYERKCQIMLADVFKDDGRFEQKLSKIHLSIERSNKSLDKFVNTKGKHYPSIKKLIEMVKEEGITSKLNSTSISITLAYNPKEESSEEKGIHIIE